MGISRGQSTAIYLIPGMTVKIKALDFFVKIDTVEHTFQSGTKSTVSLVNGFVLDNENVGTIEAVSGEPAIKYTHNKFEFNLITFYARTGEIGQISIMSVPIHDHSSIVSGGPAYGSYFSDDETVTNTT